MFEEIYQSLEKITMESWIDLVLTFVIAWATVSQRCIAKQKREDDLYERRYNFYKNFISNVEKLSFELTKSWLIEAQMLFDNQFVKKLSELIESIIKGGRITKGSEKIDYNQDPKSLINDINDVFKKYLKIN